MELNLIQHQKKKTMIPVKNKIFLVLFLISGCTNTQHHIGEQYLGKKYILSPLGEEKAPDTDPLIRSDAFDCTTFVETSLAKGDVNKLTKIRYKDGKIDFFNRNHFIESDWLYNNSDIVENVSTQYGKTAIGNVIIDKKSWLKKMYNIDSNIAKQPVALEYIPYKYLTDIKIKKPLIVLFISGNSKIYDKIGTDIAVVHMGFLLPGGILRHASRIKKSVVDTDFEEYINKLKQNKNNIGIALVKIK